MQSGQDLVVDVLGTNDKVTVQGGFGSSGAQLSAIKLADGTTIDAGISNLVSAMAAYCSSHSGFNPTAPSTVMPTDTTSQNSIAANWHQ